jgi:hypothetical protein
LTGVDEQGNALTAPFDATATVASQAKTAPDANDPSASERKQKGAEKPVVRQRRTTSADPMIDPDDPPF